MITVVIDFMMSRLILFFIILSFTIGKGFSQEIDLSRKMDFQLSEVTLAEAFRAFEEKSGIPVAYNAKILSNEKYSWTFANEPLRNILNDITHVEELTFQIQEPSILILKNQVDQAEQGPIRIEGKILDGETNEAVSFAHLLVEGTALGSVANMNGSFRLVIPEVHEGKMVIFSSVGYKNERVKITESKQGLIVKLMPEIIELNEVTVSAKKEKFNVNQLMREVVGQIANNYSDETEELEAYYREFMKLDNNYIQFADASTKILYNGYRTREFDRERNFEEYLKYNGLVEKPKVQLPRIFNDLPDIIGNRIKIEEARVSHNLQSFQTSEFRELDKRDLRVLESQDINNGPWHLLGFDHVKLRNEFLSYKGLKKFKFELVNYRKHGDGFTYEISFRSLGSYPIAGTLWIDENTKAIRKIVYNSTAEPRNRTVMLIMTLNRKERKAMGISQRRLVRKTKIQNFSVTVEYFKYQGKYHLKRISESATFLNTGEIVGDLRFQTQSDLVVTDIDRNNPNPIQKEDLFRAGNSNFLSEYPLSYNPDFWDNYSGMVLDSVFHHALEDLEKTHSLEDQFSERFVQDTSLLPPSAQIIPDTMKIHGDIRVDDYSWLRNKYSESVERYLAKENEYTHNYMIPYRKEQRKIYYEMVDKLESNYESLLTKIDNYYYGWRYEEGKPYAIFYRKTDTLSVEEEVILDENEWARGYDYYTIEDIILSTDGNTMAFIENTSGGTENLVRFKNISEQTIIADSLIDVGAIVWTYDNHSLLYTKRDSTNRAYRVYRHTLGTSQKLDELLYEEKDKRFSISVAKSKSKKYIILYVESKDENEIHLLSNDGTENQKFQLVRKRKQGISYYLKEYKDSFFILSDLNGGDYELFKAKATDISGNWKQLRSHNSDTLMTGMEVIGDYLILAEKVNMKPHLRIINQHNGFQDLIGLDSTDVYQMSLLTPDDGETDLLKYSVSSPIQPGEVYAYHMKTTETRVIKKQKVKGYDPEEYDTKRLYAKARDGVMIPITLIYKKEVDKIIKRRVLLRAYGAYGISQNVGFSVSNIPFLDQGGIIAIAHIRGGGEYGKEWYESGKMLNKKNTFYDFISCAEYLIKEGYGKKGELLAMGGSAGGLLMGVAINEHPDLFKAVVLNVPFVDVVNTMLDESIPLTAGEYKEWGNPKEMLYYNYMKSYSPYDNISRQDYPHLLFNTSYNDENVGYWEPTKMVAKLRRQKTDNNIILLKTDMYSGHSGRSGRYASFKNMSFIYSFLQSIK